MQPAWRAGLWLGVGLTAALVGASQRARAGEATGPSAAAFGIENPGVPWGQGHEGEAIDGACYGISRLTVAYMRLGLDARRPLREATTPGGGNPRAPEAQRAADLLFLEQAAALAQNYALRDSGWERRVYSQSTNPREVHRTLSESRPSPRNPQVLWMNNGDGAHAVIVDDRQELRGLGMVVYRVRDPNDPNRPQTITYHEDRGAFTPFRGRSGTYGTIRHDRSELPEQNRRWVEALAHGLAQPPDRRYLPVWRGERDQPRPPAEYERQLRGGAPRPGPAPPPAPVVEPPEPSAGLSGSVSGSGTEGGVRLYFDPDLAVSEENAGLRWRLLGPLTDQITGGGGSFLLQEGGPETLALVPLESLEGDTAAGLTRILGYALDRPSGEVYLLGRREPGRPAIALDTLTVMLRALWREGRTPAVSLDPNPDDFYGPQQVRVEGLPADLHPTEPVRVMLEADYAMKRINLGDDVLDIPGFRSEVDLLARAPQSGPGYARFWLYPRANAGAEALVTRTTDGEVLRFQSGVRLLTETMKRANDMLVGTGATDPTAEEACRLFTLHYAQIATARPIFHELQGVLDAAKLAHLLRLRGVQSPALARLADRRPARVPLRGSYPGIGPRPVGPPGRDVTLFIGGGVLSLHRAEAEDVAEARLVDAAWRPATAEGGTVTLQRPTAVPQPPQRAARLDAGLEALAAAGELLAGRVPQARERAQNALSQEPGHPVGRLIRGLCRSFLGDDRGALADLDVAAKAAPTTRLTRALVRLRLGDAPGALADARAVAATAPRDPVLLAQKARIELWALNLKTAEADLAQLARLDPLTPELLSLRSDLRVYRALPPATLRRYVRVQVAIPMGESLEFHRITTELEADPARTLPLLARLQERYATRKEGPREIAHLGDRVDLLAAEILLRPGPTQNPALAAAALRRVRARHPTWPTPLLIEADGLPGLTPEQRADRWARALALKPTDDVIGDELSARHGADVRAYFGFRVLFRLMEAQAESARRAGGPAGAPLNAAVVRVMRRLLPLLNPGPARELVGFLNRHAHLGMQARPPDAATQARIAKEMIAVVLALKPPPVAGDLDAGGLAALTRFATGMIRDPRPGTPPPGVILARVAGALEADWISEQALRAAAEAYVEAAESAARTLARGPSGPRPEPLHPGDSAREPPTDAALDDLLAQWKNVPPFFGRLIRHALLSEPNTGEPAGSARRLASLATVVAAARSRVTAGAAMHLLTQEQQAIAARGGALQGLAECERLLSRARFRARG